MGRLSSAPPVVFLGPSLPVAAARAHLHATYLPPARMGDVYRVVRDGARSVAVVDGYYERVPAVWHKEIVWALSEGVRVLGAASMGALRAAELHPLGMEGVGAVFRAFAAGDLTDDDEVALLHMPPQGDYAAVSVPLVDIRATLGSAASAGVLPDAAVPAIVAALRRLHYPERTWEAVVELVGAAGHDRFADWLPGREVSVKRADAVELLQLLASGAPAPPHPRVHFEPTWIWRDLVASVEAATPRTPGGP